MTDNCYKFSAQEYQYAETLFREPVSFVLSVADLSQLPLSEISEVAFAGRSNVGKSSLINMISARKGLAMTSSKPGKTLLINYFDINNSWYLVDLPGYGFASVDKDTRARLKRMIEEYTVGRMQLTNLFVLLDCRLEPQKNDLDFINFLGGHEVPFSLVFTKTDKISKSKLAANIAHYKEVLSGQWEWLPPIFATSSETKEGRDELLSYIEQINNSIENQE